MSRGWRTPPHALRSTHNSKVAGSNPAGPTRLATWRRRPCAPGPSERGAPRAGMRARARACDDPRMRAYIGERASNGAVRVRVEQDGVVRALPHAVRHAPDRFDYGYDGAGPADLARSILADFLGYAPKWRVYRAFLHQFIAPLDRAEPWTITEAEISAWLVLMGVGGRGEAGSLESR